MQLLSVTQVLVHARDQPKRHGSQTAALTADHLLAVQSRRCAT